MADILKIDRSKWRTGGNWGKHRTGEGDTELLNKEGYMCCLGFRCNQLGVPKKDLLGVSSPRETKWEVIPDLLDDLTYFNTIFCQDAMSINDDKNLTPKKREERIKKHFAKKKTRVVFTGKYKIPAE